MIKKHVKNPLFLTLAASVGFGLSMLAYMGYHKLRNDPTLVILDKKKNPYPYLHVKQNENVKLYAVGFKPKNYEPKPKETFF
jgi:hypothetical protein